MKSGYFTTMLNRRDHGAGPNGPIPSTQKARLHPKTAILCLWWDWKGVLYYAAAAVAKSLQSCPTLCDPLDGSPPGLHVPGILQARTLEWVAISCSTLTMNSFQKTKQFIPRTTAPN